MHCGVVHADHVTSSVSRCVTTGIDGERRPDWWTDPDCCTGERDDVWRSDVHFPPTWPALNDLHGRKGDTSVIQRLRC